MGPLRCVVCQGGGIVGHCGASMLQAVTWLLSGPPGPRGGIQPRTVPYGAGSSQVVAQCQALGPSPFAAVACPGPGVIGAWVGRTVVSGVALSC